MISPCEKVSLFLDEIRVVPVAFRGFHFFTAFHVPIIQSAIKRARQNLVRAERIRPVRSYMKTMMKKMTDLTAQKKVEEAKKILPEVFSAIDMAAKKNVIHIRNADRKKSKMSKMLAALSK